MKGYSNRILRVDLTKQSSKVEPIPKDWPRNFLGGMGFASTILFREDLRGLNAFDPGNKLIVAPGLLVGTGISTASKTIFTAKSPLTGGFGKASAGASIGPALKKANFLSI